MDYVTNINMHIYYLLYIYILIFCLKNLVYKTSIKEGKFWHYAIKEGKFWHYLQGHLFGT
jgi:hypothetical protein